MNITFCCWENIMEPKLISAFERLGHTIQAFREPCSDWDFDSSYAKKLAGLLQNSPTDFLISINYIPIISRICNIFKLPYLSWVCDSPCIPLYSETLSSPHNYVFIFDHIYANKFKSLYPDSHIYYLPACHDNHLDDDLILSEEDYNKYNCDVSFIGSLYSEKGGYNSVRNELPLYLRGYIEGLIHAQCNVYGYNFISDSISDALIEELFGFMNQEIKPGYIDCKRDVVCDYFIGYKCTEHDRITTLDAVSRHFNLDLYTTSDAALLPNAHFKGIADSKNMLPKIFQCSKINLEIVHKCIRSDITVRTYDAMGLGGFVISDYQTEIPSYFTIDKDIVVYESIPDLLNKIDYYLTHDDERMEIAKNGQEKVLKYHTYDIRVKQMLDMFKKEYHVK